MTRFYDTYQDFIDVAPRPDGSHGGVALTITDPTPSSACVLLDRDNAVKVAKAILSQADFKFVDVASADASKLTFNEGIARLAAIHKRTITFRYAKGDGAVIEQRRLNPTSVEQHGDHVLLVGYDPDRDEPRAYRSDRIKGEVEFA